MVSSADYWVIWRRKRYKDLKIQEGAYMARYQRPVPRKGSISRDSLAQNCLKRETVNPKAELTHSKHRSLPRRGFQPSGNPPKLLRSVLDLGLLSYVPDPSVLQRGTFRGTKTMSAKCAKLCGNSCCIYIWILRLGLLRQARVKG